MHLDKELRMNQTSQDSESTAHIPGLAFIPPLSAHPSLLLHLQNLIPEIL